MARRANQNARSKRKCSKVIATAEQLERAVDLVRNKGKERRPRRLGHHSSGVQDNMTRACRAGYLEKSDRFHVVPTRTLMFLLHMKRAVFKHDWTTAARCLQNIMKLGIVKTPPMNAAWRVLILILLNHRASNESLVMELMEHVLNVTNENEIEMCIMRLLTLPSKLSDYDLYARHSVKESYYDDDDGEICFIDSD